MNEQVGPRKQVMEFIPNTLSLCKLMEVGVAVKVIPITAVRDYY